MFIVFGGLPGTGKTTLARYLAGALGAVLVRIDSIEQAVVRSGVARHQLGTAGYVVGYAVAEDNLRQGLTVVADSVNPLAVSRDAWRDTAVRAAVPVFEVEVVCSDAKEHRRRVEARVSDIPGLRLPTWQEVLDRDYEPWTRERMVIDTAGRDVEACVAELRSAVA